MPESPAYERMLARFVDALMADGAVPIDLEAEAAAEGFSISTLIRDAERRFASQQ